MQIDFTQDELELLKESLNYAMMSYDSKSAPYLASVENYREIYKHKKELFESLKKKINQK